MYAIKQPQTASSQFLRQGRPFHTLSHAPLTFTFGRLADQAFVPRPSHNETPIFGGHGEKAQPPKPVPEAAAPKRTFRQRMKAYLEVHPKQKLTARLAGFGIYGYGLGQAFQWVFAHGGIPAGLATTALVGSMPFISNKIASVIKSKAAGPSPADATSASVKEAPSPLSSKITTFISADSISGQVMYPAQMTTVSMLAPHVHSPIEGLAAGAATLLAGYVAATITFYTIWGLANLNKYRQTGFGKLSDLKALPHYFADTVLHLKKKLSAPRKEVEAGSFLSEFAEFHGTSLACAMPSMLATVASGLIAGCTSQFLPTFMTLYNVSWQYLVTIYISFYMFVTNRANSVVKKSGAE